MSVKIMGLVWDLRIDKEKKFILLAYADHADHEGGNIYPSNELIAHKTSYSVRSVQRIRRSLEDDGYLILEEAGGGRAKPSKWRIPIKGDKITPFIKGDTGDAKNQERVTPATLNHDIAMSPESSLTVNNINHPDFSENSGETEETGLSVEEEFERDFGKPQERASVPRTAEEVRAGVVSAIQTFESNRGTKDSKLENYLQRVPVHLQPLARAFCNQHGRPPTSREDKHWRAGWADQYEIGLEPGAINAAYSEMVSKKLDISSPRSITTFAERIQKRGASKPVAKQGELDLSSPLNEQGYIYAGR